jgi:3-hydroxyisobutyrate dehydrogenase-like beta-hydroxyacid dehydrogenase
VRTRGGRVSQVYGSPVSTASGGSEGDAAPPLRSVAFVGFGSLAAALAPAVRGAGVASVRAWVRPRRGTAAADLHARLSEAGIEASASLEQAVAEAELVLAAVPAAAARAVAEECARAVSPGSVYVDPAPLPPAEKLGSSELLAAAGAFYVDAAVLGTVLTEGARVPILAAGPGADGFARLAASLGLRVDVIDGPAGQASLLKLIRSVYMKGRDALILEMLLAARHHGLEQAVIESIGGTGEQVPFSELASRAMCSLALYAERRADELGASADVLAAAGVEPLVTAAGEVRLRRLAELNLKTRLGGERPRDLREVFSLIEELEQARADGR